MNIDFKDRTDNRPSPRNQNEADFRNDPPQAPGVVDGTVGWEGVDSHYELGSDENDGYLLVKVQLFGGKPPYVPAKPGVAQGHQILCRVGLMPFRVPPKGAVVVVALPYGDIETPGRGVIIAAVEKNPTTQFDADRCVWDVGADTHLVLRGKSVTLQSTDDPFPQFVSVGTPKAGGPKGIYVVDETGSGFNIQSGAIGIFASDGGSPPDAKTMIQLTQAQMEFVQKTANGTTMAVIGADQIQTIAVEKTVILSGQTILASDAASAAAALPIATGPAGATVSLSVYAGL